MRNTVLFFILSAVLSLSASTPLDTLQAETDEQYPKNIILMISDGCGFNQAAAASLYQYGQDGTQIYEKFPVKLAMSTYSKSGEGYDPQSAWKSFRYLLNKPTDSAAAATAMAAGIKTKNGYISFDSDKMPVETVLERAESWGKSTGVVTSVQFSHATPAAFAAHNKSRGNYEEIAREMIFASSVDVIMGAGHPHFDDNGRPDHGKSYKYTGGKDSWQLLTEGLAGNDADGDGEFEFWQLIQDKQQFVDLMSGPAPERVIGIPKVHSTLQQNRKDSDDEQLPFDTPLLENIPSLAEMTSAALNVLDDNPSGLFLMIEGGAVDWSGHNNNSVRVIEEQIDFNRAVEAAAAWIETSSSWDETLLIVTADHETGYLTGPDSGSKSKPVWNPLVNNGQGKMPGMEWHSGGHTNQLVPFYAKGAGSGAFITLADQEDPERGSFLDNTDIANVIFSIYDLKKN